MMPHVIPQDISLCFARRDSMPVVQLFPEEEAICERWRSEDRKMLFRLGRTAAHEAIKKLGIDAQKPILRGSEGEPVWPDGITGSISNTAGVAVAAVGLRARYLSLGIDLEVRTRLIREDTAKFICTDRELELYRAESFPLLRLFSAKECVYKAVAPLANHYIGFKDVELTWDASGSSWEIEPLSGDLPRLAWEMLRISSTEHEEFFLSFLPVPQTSL